MSKQSRNGRALGKVLVVGLLAMLAFAATAQAKLVGEFTKFQYCPYTSTEVKKCVVAVTEGGEVKLGSKTVPIVNPVTLQGGFGAPDKTTKISKFFGATNGVTLSKTPQPVPGGLAGLVNCKEISNFILKAACEWTFENGLTGLNSTLEVAGSANNIEISETFMSRKENTALKLPLKIHLENPFLGSSCYVGSDGSPVIWNLTSGPTADEKISGTFGQASFLEEGLILHIDENVLVDNAWSAPGVNGCGGIFSFILNPIINLAAGLPSAAGNNVAVLENTLDITTAAALKFIDAENP